MFRPLVRLLLFLAGATLLLDTLESFEVGESFIISPNKAITAILLVVAVFYGLTSGVRFPRNSKSWWLLGFYLSLMVSSIYAWSQGTSAVGLALLWTTYIAMFVFYHLLCFVLQNRKDLDLLLLSLVVSGLIAAVSSLVLEGTGGVWSPYRRSGVGAGSNQAAGNLLMVIPMVFALGYGLRSLFARALLYGSTVVLAIGFVVTLSRSGFLAVLAMGGLWLLRMRRLSDLRIVAAGVVLAIVATIAAPEGYSDRISSLGRIFGRGRGTAADEIDYRAHIYELGAIAFATHPVIGVGTERFQTWAAERDLSNLGIHEVHNAFLKVAGNQGLLGLIPYVALIWLTFADLSRVQKLAHQYRHLQDDELGQLYIRAVTIQVGFIGILTVAQFQPGTFWRGIWAVMAISTVLLDMTRRRIAVLQSRSVASDTAGLASFTPGFEEGAFGTLRI